MSDQTALIAATLMQSYGSQAMHHPQNYADVMRRAVDLAVLLEELAAERESRGTRLSAPTKWELQSEALAEVERALK